MRKQKIWFGFSLMLALALFFTASAGLALAEQGELQGAYATVAGVPEPQEGEGLAGLIIFTGFQAAQIQSTALLGDAQAAYPERPLFVPEQLEYELVVDDSLLGENIRFALVTAESGATVTAYWQRDGETQQKELVATAGLDVYTGRNFIQPLTAPGKNSFQLVVTPPEGSTQQQVTYTFHINCRPSLAGLSLTQSGAPVHLTPAFAAHVLDYTATVNAAAPLTISAVNPHGYALTYQGGTEQVLDLAELEELEITVSVGAEADLLSTTYRIALQKQLGHMLEARLTPAEAVFVLYDAQQQRIAPDAAGVYTLLPGNAYHYVASCSGYLMQTGQIMAADLESGLITLDLQAAPASSQPLPDYDGDWLNFRGNAQNMGVTAALTPTNPEATVLKWFASSGTGWDSSPTPPIILNGELYVAANSGIYRIHKETGAKLAESAELAGSLGYAMNPITYGAGMLFVQISNGRVQALNAETLESLWVSEPLGGQTLSPITYHDGYLYTGTWNSETALGSYFCLAVTDEDPSRGDEEKRCSWRLDHPGGFYWAGAYATDDYLIFGSDDGYREGAAQDKAVLYSVHPRTGLVLDTITGIQGDIRSTVAYDAATNRVYFTTKGGWFYAVRVNTDGSFDRASVQCLEIGGMSTGTPLIYDGLAYLGVGSEEGQFETEGHSYLIVDVTTTPMKPVAEIEMPGYVQTSALLSTAYVRESGLVYIYATFNAKPGGIYMLAVEKTAERDADGAAVVRVTGSLLFNPAAHNPSLNQHCICSLVCDADGTLYYKNDSAYLMAVRAKPNDPAQLVLSQGVAKRTSAAQAEISFQANLAGSYYYAVVEAGANAPALDAGGAASALLAGNNTLQLVNLSGGGAYDLHIQAFDGQKSSTDGLVIRIPKYEESGGTPGGPGDPAGNVRISTTLENGMSHKGTHLTFDVWARQGDAKVNCSATLNGVTVPVAYDDAEKTSFTLVFTSAGRNEVVVKAGNQTETYSINCTLAQPGETIGSIVLAVEAFTIGGGYVLEPQEVSLIEGETAAQMLLRVLGREGYSYTYTGRGDKSFYLAEIKGNNIGGLPMSAAQIPDYLLQCLKDKGFDIIGRRAQNALGEFDFTNASGWMYCVNGTFPNVGFSDYYMSSGNVMRVQFTLALGRDIGGDYAVGSGGENKFYTVANKDELTRAIANAGLNSVPQEVLDVMMKLNASAGEVSNALKLLNGGETVGTETETIKEITTVLRPDAQAEDGLAVVKFTLAEISAYIKEAQEKNSSRIIISPRISGTVTEIMLELPLAALGSIATDTQAGLTLQTALGQFTLQHQAFAALAREEGELFRLIARLDAQGYIQVEVKIDDKLITEIAGGIRVGLPVAAQIGEEAVPLAAAPGQSESSFVPWQKQAGQPEAMLKKSYVANGEVFVLVEGPASLVLKQNLVQFADVPRHYWGFEMITFAAARELFQGTAQDQFSPDAPMTRAMLVAVLHRLENEPTAQSGRAFADLAPAAWYAEAAAWAGEAEIVLGTENGFDAQLQITREQLATMLCRYAAYLGLETATEAELTGFGDLRRASDWALESLAWAVSTGVMQGRSATSLVPEGYASRAEVATMLQRFIVMLVQ